MNKLKIKQFFRRTLECSEFLACVVKSKCSSGHSDGTIYIMQNSHLGDFVLSLPFFERLRKHYADRQLVLISDKNIRELAETCGLFDRFIGIDMKKASGYRHIFYRWQIFRKLSDLTGSAFIQCFGVGATNFEDCAALLVQAPEKYVFVDSPYNVLRSGVIYEGLRTKFFNHTLPYRLEHSLLWNENNFADFITKQTEPVQVGNLEMFEPLPEPPPSDYVLLIPGANDARRRWEPEKFASAAEAVLEQKPNWQILLSGTPQEDDILEAVIKALPEKLRQKVVKRPPTADKLTGIRQLMSDVKNSELVITNDTAPLHIAAKYGVKTICITGGWHWGVFAPCEEYKNTKFIYHQMPCYKCGSFCKYNTIPFKCLQGIPSETVSTSIAEQI